jgi:hypothetical protein
MKKQPAPISMDESRALARRLLDPWWQAAHEKGDDNTRYWVLRFMAPVDPAGVLDELEATRFPIEKNRSTIQSLVARALGRIDPDEAATVAESIADAGTCAGTLCRLADIFPAAQRDSKLALLDRAAVHARGVSDPTERLYQLGEVGARWVELGETVKAEAIFAQGAAHANQFPDTSRWRGSFIGALARVDLAAALVLAKPLAGTAYGLGTAGSIAWGLAWGNPSQVEQFLAQYPIERAQDWLVPAVTWKIATLDPARAATGCGPDR